MFSDLRLALGRPSVWLYTAWVQFHIIYRRTAMGPLWVILTPLAFIMLLGFLYSAITQSEFDAFLPHLTAGFIIWTFIGEVVGQSSTLYIRSKSALMSGVTNHCVLHLRLIARAFIKFLHHIVLIVGVCVYFHVVPTERLILVIPALGLLLIHAWWVSILFSIVAARFRDVAELTELIMRIGFLATPIIWIPSEDVRSAIIDSYLLYNPFYHVLEPIRSAILGTPFPYVSLMISTVLALVGMCFAILAYSSFRKKAVLWI